MVQVLCHEDRYTFGALDSTKIELMCEMKKECFLGGRNFTPTPYAPDFPSSEVKPFEPLNKHLEGQNSRTNAEFQQAVFKCLHKRR
ncbi:hypothetical protein TNCV_3714901 [Trichonephila clavipes]|nr:hypothetical protein TNCV_3714901 [Trichonephila clavipes]